MLYDMQSALHSRPQERQERRRPLVAATFNNLVAPEMMNWASFIFEK